jgi:hypothetical protein
MAEVTVLRVEVSGSSGTDSKSLTTTAAVASGIGRKTTGGTPSPMAQQLGRQILTGDGPTKINQRYSGRAAQLQAQQKAKQFMKNEWNEGQIPFKSGMMYLKNQTREQIVRKSVSGATALVGPQALYSQYRSTGMQLSGSSHAAVQQQRKTQRLGMATGIGVAVASGRPEAAVLMIAARAWQMSQQNRQTLFRLQADQMTSNILQQRLVKNTIERRF